MILQGDATSKSTHRTMMASDRYKLEGSGGLLFPLNKPSSLHEFFLSGRAPAACLCKISSASSRLNNIYSNARDRHDLALYALCYSCADSASYR